MNQAAPGTLIPETFLSWSQDVLFDRAGLMRRRGPFEEFDLFKAQTTGSGIVDTKFDFTDALANDERVLGVLSTYDPSGDERIGVLVHKDVNNTFSNVLRVFNSSFVFLGEEVLPFSAQPLSIMFARPALGGGLWVSLASDPADPNTHYQFFWRGGAGNVDKASTTVTNLFTTKSMTVTTATGVNKGMFAYVLHSGSYYLIGTVASVVGTTVTLEKEPFVWDSSFSDPTTLSTLVSSDKTIKFVSARPYEHVHGRGLLTVVSGSKVLTSGAIGTSAEGHWKAADVIGWHVYRASDNKFIGKVVTPVNNPATNFTNAAAELGHNAPFAMAGDEYVMRNATATNLNTKFKVGDSNNTITNFAGLYTTVYAGYQWYGNFAKDDQNTNRVVFSAPHDKEAVDLSRDAADSIVFPGKSKFRGMGASNAGLLVFLEERTYILRGNDRTNFSVEQLVPEGCLSPSSIVEYGGGVFWAGKSGIMFFDGASVRNLTKDNLGLYYTDSLDIFNPERDRVIGFIHKNNLIMHYTAWKSQFDPVRYEPIYAADWQNTPGIADRGWDEFDSDFDYDDFFTENNTPIFWDQTILNNPEESASTGVGITWGPDLNAGEWGGNSNVQKWGPLRTNTSITFNIYLPTNALTTLSNIDPRGHTSIETVYGLKTILGVNSVESNASFFVAEKTASGFQRDLIINGGEIAIGDTVIVDINDPLFDGTFTVTAFNASTNTITYVTLVDYLGTLNVVTNIGTVTKLFNNRLRARLIDIHPVFDTNSNGDDNLLVEKINMPPQDLIRGPDFYLQTKHFTVGDPILRKWFQRVLLSMLLYDGAMRMDLLDDDNNDEVNINKKKPRNWALFTEKGYSWTYLDTIQFPKIVSPNKATWFNVEATVSDWDELFTSDFNRYSKRISWRKSSVGFRLYQLNRYKKPFNGVVTRPTRVELQGFSIGFKPLRQGRV
jgi:hypothetical protein